MIELNIDVDKIKQNVDEPLHLKYKDVTMSTNEDVKELLRNNLHGNIVVIAKEQNGGRGRIGHKFSSPKGGIYLSLNVDITKVIKRLFFILFS